MQRCEEGEVCGQAEISRQEQGEAQKEVTYLSADRPVDT